MYSWDVNVRLFSMEHMNGDTDDRGNGFIRDEKLKGLAIDTRDKMNET